jgi:hypothetical protein
MGESQAVAVQVFTFKSRGLVLPIAFGRSSLPPGRRGCDVSASVYFYIDGNDGK